MQVHNNKRTIRFLSSAVVALCACGIFFAGTARAQATYSVSGTVEDCCGNLLPGIQVNLYDPHYDLIDSELTDISGFYLFDITAYMEGLQDEGRAQGIFKLEFTDKNRRFLCYVTEWFDNKFNFQDADRFLVTQAEPDAVKNIKLYAGGTIAGRVTDSLDQPIAHVQVTAESPYGSMYSAYTADNGTYAVAGLPVAPYRVFFDGFLSAGAFAWEWYDDMLSRESAETLLIASYGQAISAIDAQLDRAGKISGWISDPQGARLPGIGVRLYPADSITYEQIDADITKADGTYSFDYLQPGTYKLYFEPKEGAEQYAGEWYNNKNSFASADAVAVAAGEETADINAQLALSGEITGKVMGLWRRGIRDAQVLVFDADAPAFGPDAAVILPEAAITDDTGAYAVTGLSRGNYKLYFETYATGYSPEWFRNRAEFKAAAKIVVGPGKTVKKINAVLNRAKVGFPFPGLANCPAINTLGNNEPQLSILRAFRDAVLETSEKGRSYANLYYAHGPEISQLLDKQAHLKDRSAAALVEALPLLTRRLAGATDIELPESLLLAVQDIASGLSVKAGADLRAALAAVTADLQDDAALKQLGFRSGK